MLAAIILESESWSQSGDAAAEELSGWVEDRLISTVATATNLTHTQTLRLEKGETSAVWVIAVGTFLGALATWVIACHSP